MTPPEPPSEPLWSLGADEIVAGIRGERLGDVDVIGACLDPMAGRAPVIGARASRAGEAAPAGRVSDPGPSVLRRGMRPVS